MTKRTARRWSMTRLLLKIAAYLSIVNQLVVGVIVRRTKVNNDVNQETRVYEGIYCSPT